MPNHILHFPSLLKTSWQASILILLVLVVQACFGRRLQPRWRYALWLPASSLDSNRSPKTRRRPSRPLAQEDVGRALSGDVPRREESDRRSAP